MNNGSRNGKAESSGAAKRAAKSNAKGRPNRAAIAEENGSAPAGASGSDPARANASEAPVRDKRGRPPLLDDFKQQQLIGLVSAGCSLTMAAHYLHVSRRNLLYTLRNNPDLKLRVDQARVACELVPLGQIRTAGRDSWRAGAWFLEHVRPRRYQRGGSRRLGADAAVRLINRLIRQITDEIEDEQLSSRIFAIGDEAKRWIRCDLTDSKTARDPAHDPTLPTIEEMLSNYA